MKTMTKIKIVFICFLVLVLGFLIYKSASAVDVPFHRNFSVVKEMINSTVYTKNSNGTVNKIEQITRTTIIDPMVLQAQITNLQTQKDTLQAQKVLLDNIK